MCYSETIHFWPAMSAENSVEIPRKITPHTPHRANADTLHRLGARDNGSGRPNRNAITKRCNRTRISCLWQTINLEPQMCDDCSETRMRYRATFPGASVRLSIKT